jgi:hypothetical protein
LALLAAEIALRYYAEDFCSINRSVAERTQVNTVHIFVSTGRFKSFEEMRAYIDETYTEDGDGVPSAFMQEVGLSEYEPGCIEAIHSDSGRPISLAELLTGASYADQWLPGLDGSRLVDAAICVFSPNRLKRPEGCSLEYIGAFTYGALHLGY